MTPIDTAARAPEQVGSGLEPYEETAALPAAATSPGARKDARRGAP